MWEGYATAQGRNLDTSDCPHLTSLPGCRAGLDVQGLQARPWRLLSAPSPRFPERRRVFPPADVDGSRGLAGLCSKGGRHKRARRDFSTRACVVGTIGFVGGRAAHLRVPAGHSVTTSAAERAEHLRALAACDGTHIRLARHEWGTVSEMSPPFRSACPDSTRLFLKDLPRAIRRVAPLYISPTKPPPARTCPIITRNPGQAIQSRASHSIQGDPFVVQLVRRRGLRAGLTLGLENRAGGAAALAEAAGVLVVGHLRSKAAAQRQNRLTKRQLTRARGRNW